MTNFHDSGDTPSEVTVPLVSERLSVDTRVVERRRIRIQKTSTEHMEVAEALLHDDVVELTRRPVNRIVDAAPEIREEGDLLIIPVLEEIMVVETRLVLKEEIVVRRNRVAHQFTENVSLRREEVTVESVDLPMVD